MSWLRWAWVGPLLLGLLLDLDATRPPLLLAMLVTTVAAASALVAWCVWRAAPVTVTAWSRPARTATDARAGLSARHLPSRAGQAAAALALLTAATSVVCARTESVPSAAVLWAGTVATGAVMARAHTLGDTLAVVLLGLSTSTVPLVEAGGSTLALLTLVGVGTAAAIGWQVRERARRVAQTRARTIAEERAALALELHDSVAHEITGIIVLAQAARTASTDLPEDSPVRTSLTYIEAASARALDQVRGLVDTLREGSPELSTAPAGHDRGAAGPRALRRLVDEVAAADRLDLDLRIDDLPLPVPAWLGLQRVVREALTNVRRHAPATRHLGVHLVAEGQQAVLRVVDDGAGDAHEGRAGLGPGLGSGLAGIAERAQALGGQACAGPTQTGWQVTVRLPLEDAPESGVAGTGRAAAGPSGLPRVGGGAR